MQHNFDCFHSADSLSFTLRPESRLINGVYYFSQPNNAYRLCLDHLSLYRHYSQPSCPTKNPEWETPEAQTADGGRSEPPPVSRQAVTHGVVRLSGWVRNAATK